MDAVNEYLATLLEVSHAPLISKFSHSSSFPLLIILDVSGPSFVSPLSFETSFAAAFFLVCACSGPVQNQIKFLVFAHHKVMLDAIENFFSSHVCIFCLVKPSRIKDSWHVLLFSLHGGTLSH